MKVENEESDVEEDSDESDDEEYGLSYLARDDIVVGLWILDFFGVVILND